MHKMNTSASSRGNIKVVHLENFPSWFPRKWGLHWGLCNHHSTFLGEPALGLLPAPWFTCLCILVGAQLSCMCWEDSIWQLHWTVLAFEFRSFKVILGNYIPFTISSQFISHSHLLLQSSLLSFTDDIAFA